MTRITTISTAIIILLFLFSCAPQDTAQAQPEGSFERALRLARTGPCAQIGIIDERGATYYLSYWNFKLNRTNGNGPHCWVSCDVSTLENKSQTSMVCS